MVSIMYYLQEAQAEEAIIILQPTVFIPPVLLHLYLLILKRGCSQFLLVLSALEVNVLLTAGITGRVPGLWRAMCICLNNHKRFLLCGSKLFG